MDEKKFKYGDILSRFKDCPELDCNEVERDVYRWVHSKPSAEDFIPLPLMPDIDKRPIDLTDLKNHSCEAFSLSMWVDKDKAKQKLLNFIVKHPPELRAEYIDRKGDTIGLIHIKKEYGKCSPPNKKGHISLFEYEGVELHECIADLFYIFETK